MVNFLRINIWRRIHNFVVWNRWLCAIWVIIRACFRNSLNNIYLCSVFICAYLKNICLCSVFICAYLKNIYLCRVFICAYLTTLFQLSGATRWRNCLSHRTARRKFVVSILDVGIFYWHNHSGCTIAPVSIQIRTEVSTRNIYLG
jgi:small basic protein